MVEQHYRWDFIGLSTDTKPTPATSEKVVDGSTFYCSDTSKLYVFCKNDWYERKPLGGGGGGTSYTAGTGIDITDDTISVDTDTIQEKLTAGTNITISDNTISATDTTYTAGSNVSISDENVISATNTTYTAGSNVSISDQNVISATDTTYSNFTGTDGTSAGVSGLVPAPATTDAGKFLKADGTWDTAGGGGGADTGKARVLTSADYDYPTASPDGVALWNLDSGLYFTNGAKVYFNNLDSETYALVTISKGNSVTRMTCLNSGDQYSTTKSTGARFGDNNILLNSSFVVDNLVTTSIDRPLSANQGKELHGIRGAGAPTTATEGIVGKIYVDSTSDTAYVCVGTTGGYTWKQITT